MGLEILQPDVSQKMVIPCYLLSLEFLIVRHVVVHYLLDVFEVLVEDLMDERWLSNKSLAAHIGLSQQYGVLESVLTLLFVITH